MKPTIVEATFVYIRGGLSAQKNTPYLMVSNGRKEMYLNIPKGSDIDADTFNAYKEGDDITLKVSTLIGSDSVTYIAIA